jgi:hypothetical protein
VIPTTWHLTNLAGTAARLTVDHERCRDRDEVSRIEGEPFLEPGADGAATHFIERRAIPPALHVGLAKRKRATSEDVREKGRGMNLDVPRAGAVDLDVRCAKKILDYPPFRCHRTPEAECHRAARHET